jgi:hypothetical protein
MSEVHTDKSGIGWLQTKDVFSHEMQQYPKNSSIRSRNEKQAYFIDFVHLHGRSFFGHRLRWRRTAERYGEDPIGKIGRRCENHRHYGQRGIQSRIAQSQKVE